MKLLKILENDKLTEYVILGWFNTNYSIFYLKLVSGTGWHYEDGTTVSDKIIRKLRDIDVASDYIKRNRFNTT